MSTKTVRSTKMIIKQETDRNKGAKAQRHIAETERVHHEGTKSTKKSKV